MYAETWEIRRFSFVFSAGSVLIVVLDHIPGILILSHAPKRTVHAFFLLCVFGTSGMQTTAFFSSLRLRCVTVLEVKYQTGDKKNKRGFDIVPVAGGCPRAPIAHV